MNQTRKSRATLAFSTSKGCGKPSGFTLLELILALAIFVGASAALAALMSIGSENAQYAELKAIGGIICENRFNELEIGLITPDDAGTYGDDVHPDWQWTLLAEPTDTTNLYMVQVSAQPVGVPGMESLVVERYRYYFDKAQATLDAQNAAASSGSSASSGGTSP